MSKIGRVLLLLGVLSFTVGCHDDDSTKPAPKVKAPDTTVSTPDATPEPSPEPVLEDERSDVQIKIGDIFINTQDSEVEADKLNNLSLVTKLERVLCGDLYTDLIGDELLSEFSQNSLDNVCTSLFYMSGGEVGVTVGIGSKQDSSSELIVSRANSDAELKLNLLIHPNSNGRIDLINLVYLIDYYSHVSPSEYFENDRFCFNQQTAIIRCNNIKSIEVMQRPWNNVVNIAIRWVTYELNVKRFELTLTNNDDGSSSVHSPSGDARAWYILNLDPTTSYSAVLKATHNNGFVEKTSIDFRTRQAL